MFVSFVATLFHEFVGDLGSFVRPGGMRGAITIRGGSDPSRVLNSPKKKKKKREGLAYPVEG